MKPPGWPAGVCDPDEADFVESAQRWLWDVGSIPRDPESVWTRNPTALAFRVVIDLQARVEGARNAYSRARTALGSEGVDVDQVLSWIEGEAAELQRWHREALLVAEALDGQRWGPRL